MRGKRRGSTVKCEGARVHLPLRGFLRAHALVKLLEEGLGFLLDRKPLRRHSSVGQRHTQAARRRASRRNGPARERHQQ
eukprot:6180626-Pleurochrysis_carterae.AAC.1